MAYITYDEYVTYYGTPPVQESDFTVYAEQASDLIDVLTEYRIMRGGLSALPDLVQKLVKKATAAQVLYFIQNGGVESVESGQTGQGFSVGKVRVDGDSRYRAQNISKRGALMISPMARALLEQTGLMERVVACYDRYPGFLFPIM